MIRRIHMHAATTTIGTPSRIASATMMTTISQTPRVMRAVGVMGFPSWNRSGG
jgi:hypothetical protein